MANSSAKKTAAQNAQAIRNLRLGMSLSLLLSIVTRLLFRRASTNSKTIISVFVSTLIAEVFLYRYLVKIGTSRKDPKTGVLLSSGEDLSSQGVIDWCFDVIYITWACQVGSGIFGEWFWWLYLSIPLYALYKSWNFVRPFILPSKSTTTSGTADDETSQDVSKRQQKLRKREERGNTRLQTVQGRR